jgi:hypothetical protein
MLVLFDDRRQRFGHLEVGGTSDTPQYSKEKAEVHHKHEKKHFSLHPEPPNLSVQSDGDIANRQILLSGNEQIRYSLPKKIYYL